MQSSFTSMSETIRDRAIMNIFPVNSILTERFESLDKIKALKMSVLFLHGQADSVVPVEMSQRLYEAAPGSKQLFLIPNADHVSIYQSGEYSYLNAIEMFIVQFMAQ